MELTPEILKAAQKRATERMAKETAEAGMPMFMSALIGAVVAHYAVMIAQELGVLPPGGMLSLKDHIGLALGGEIEKIQETIVSQADDATKH